MATETAISENYNAKSRSDYFLADEFARDWELIIVLKR